MKILLVDDDVRKAKDVTNALLASGVPDESFIEHATNAADALRSMEQQRYDLLILDLAIPKSKADEIDVDGGKKLLRRLTTSDRYLQPEHIVGLTSVDDAYNASIAEFDGALWTIARFDTNSSEWIAQLASRVKHIQAKQSARASGIEYDYDIAIICALERPELKAVLDQYPGLKELEDPSDPTRYRHGRVTIGDRKDCRLVVCSAPRMGMAHASALTGKLCVKFRPKIVMMTGICAGRVGEVNLGDIIIANPSWDYGSGKFSNDKKDSTIFEPDPHQMTLDPMLRKSAERVAEDGKYLDELRRSFSGAVPDTALRAKVSPMASGAAVRTDDGFFATMAKHHRKIVAIDMETYGVFAAASEMPEPKPKVLVVKGVSDFANSNKDDRYQDYAAFVSARFAFEVLARLDQKIGSS
ncbi:MAG: hypothetical protein RH945_02450 [Hyphomonas sp.]